MMTDENSNNDADHNNEDITVYNDDINAHDNNNCIHLINSQGK